MQTGLFFLTKVCMLLAQMNFYTAMSRYLLVSSYGFGEAEAQRISTKTDAFATYTAVKNKCPFLCDQKSKVFYSYPWNYGRC